MDLDRQELRLLTNGRVKERFSVSTGVRGAGEEMGSGCTPRGMHRIRLKIGAGCPENSVFVGRRATGEIYSAHLGHEHPERDWILTRIIWLTGCEPGQNRGGSVDTLRRFIYIHGTPESEPMGVAASHGCIRMRNTDLLRLFEMVDVGTPVDIRESFR
ncbi:MAG: L,D-transpeptidase [Sedimenticola sp.]|nr:L,D-transpeptidase [Sedimenticola sp.]